MRKRTLIILQASVFVLGLAIVGCRTTTDRYTAGGAATGGVIGAIIGHNIDGGSSEGGALLGAMTGALLGGEIGTTREEQKRAQHRINQLEKQANTRTVWIRNSNGSRTAVVLRKAGGGQWIGPKGEYYDHFPSEEELRPVYGL
jgi:uncharacterized protein YcfJ